MRLLTQRVYLLRHAMVKRRDSEGLGCRFLESKRQAEVKRAPEEASANANLQDLIPNYIQVLMPCHRSLSGTMSPWMSESWGGKRAR